jgi:hypothetical protein
MPHLTKHLRTCRISSRVPFALTAPSSQRLRYPPAPLRTTACGLDVALSSRVSVAVPVPDYPVCVAELFFGPYSSRRIFHPFSESVNTHVDSELCTNPAPSRCVRAPHSESTRKVMCPQTRPRLPIPPTIWWRTFPRDSASSPRLIWLESPSTGILGRCLAWGTVRFSEALPSPSLMLSCPPLPGLA